MLNYQRLNPIKTSFSHGFPMVFLGITRFCPCREAPHRPGERAVAGVHRHAAGPAPRSQVVTRGTWKTRRRVFQWCVCVEWMEIYG